MFKNIFVEDNSSHAINLDPEQREELDKLIESLKKEVALPKKPREKVTASTIGHG